MPGCCRPHRTCRRHHCRPQQGARCCHHAPLMSSHGRAAYPIPPSSRPRVFGWLLRVKYRTAGHLRPLLYFIFVIFFVAQFAAPKSEKHPPIHSTPAVHPLHRLSYRCLRLSVDCCVLRPNGGHLRPRTRPPLYFSMHLNSASQPREPAAARAYFTHRKAPATAVGLLPNLETARRERSVLLLEEQNLLVKEEKEVCAYNTKMDFMSSSLNLR